MSALSASNIDAIAYHLEHGYDNGSISREALALQLRSVAKEMTQDISDLASLRADLAQAQATVTAQNAQLEQALEIISNPLCGHYEQPCKCEYCTEVQMWLAAYPAPARDGVTLARKLQEAVDKHAAEIAEIE